MPTTFGATGHVLDLSDTEGFKLGRKRAFPDARDPATLVFTNFSQDELAQQLTQKYFLGAGESGAAPKPTRVAHEVPRKGAPRPKTAVARAQGREERLPPSLAGTTRFGCTTERVTADAVAAHQRERLAASRKVFAATTAAHGAAYHAIYNADSPAPTGSVKRERNRGKRTMPHRRATRDFHASESELAELIAERARTAQATPEVHDATYHLMYPETGDTDTAAPTASSATGKRRAILHQTFDELQFTKQRLEKSQEQTRLAKLQRVMRMRAGGTANERAALFRKGRSLHVHNTPGGRPRPKTAGNGRAASTPRSDAVEMEASGNRRPGPSKLTRALKAAIAEAYDTRAARYAAEAGRTRTLLAAAAGLGADVPTDALPEDLRPHHAHFATA